MLYVILKNRLRWTRHCAINTVKPDPGKPKPVSKSRKPENK
jgi:hypothetical protein